MPTLPNPRDLLSEAIRVVGRNSLAMCTTVGPDGEPFSRWMGAVAVDGLRKVYTLSARGARKLEHINANPSICWVFSSRDQSDVVTIYGQARVLDDVGMARAAWERLAAMARNYAMGVTSGENLELVTIETTVKSAEFLSPRLGIFMAVKVDLNADKG